MGSNYLLLVWVAVKYKSTTFAMKSKKPTLICKIPSSLSSITGQYYIAQ
jgi:hypothetical protein